MINTASKLKYAASLVNDARDDLDERGTLSNVVSAESFISRISAALRILDSARREAEEVVK